MKYFKVLSITLFSLLFLQACDDDDKKETVTETPITQNTIVDVAANDGKFTTLVAALEATGLNVALADTTKKFTVFAPTDEAFALLGDDTINALLADTDTLSDILTYHVIDGEVDANAAIAAAGTTVNMLNGDAIGLSLNDENLLVNTATVIATNIQTDNGIIHVIDAVLLPPTSSTSLMTNIVDTAIENGNFTTLVAALQATNLDEILADESQIFTVFAPTDNAFALIGSETISMLLNNTDVLSSILLQHVVVGSAVNSINAFTLSGQMVETASMAKISIDINQNTDKLMFGGANIIISDIYTANGIIHVIDAVVIGDVELPAPAMSIVDVASANGNFNSLVAALQATGLASTLADLDSEYTVFAPTDSAFAKLPAGTLESLTAEQLTDILLYHVFPGKILSDTAISVAQSAQNKVQTANGKQAALSFVDSMLFINGSKINTADVMADNGVIHVIDNVILPPTAMTAPTQNIVEVALADPDNFSTLVDALVVADLVTTLSNEDAMFTVFAPTNAAFAAIDPNALSALLADTEALTAVLLTHVVSNATLSSIDAYAANGKMITTASGEKINVGINTETGMLMIGGANVVIADIYTTNGVIHVIDTVILN